MDLTRISEHYVVAENERNTASRDIDRRAGNGLTGEKTTVLPETVLTYRDGLEQALIKTIIGEGVILRQKGTSMRNVDKIVMKSTISTGKTGRCLRRKNDRKTSSFGWKDRVFGLVFGIVFLAFTPFSFAQEGITRVNVSNNDNEVVFVLEFHNTGSPTEISSWDFSQAEIDAMVEAAQYWVDVLKPTGEMPQQRDADGNPVYDASGNPVRQPVIVSIVNDSSVVLNASAGTNGTVASQLKDSYYDVARPQALIADGTYVSPATWEVVLDDEGNAISYGYVDDPNGAHASVTIGLGWTSNSGNENQSGRSTNDLSPVMIHELGHALGILASRTYDIDPESLDITWRFDDRLNRWDTLLRDNNGNAPLAGKTIGYDEEGTNVREIFDIGDPKASSLENPSRVTFVGQNALELWYDKPYEKLTASQRKIGVPIQGYVYNFGDNYPYDLQWIVAGGGTLSHIDTTNSLMSWQSYRNYPQFIEIELAILQDIGYTGIERRNFFGKSYYVDGDGITVQKNTANFGEWDSDKQGYTKNANQSSYAIGTHLFAKNLNILQSGNILADGPGSAGVRIDGSSNKLTVDAGTYIRTNGLNGIGVLTAYGKNHQIVHNGHIEATADGGIGVSFNFGEDTFGSNRGSYYYTLIPYTPIETYFGEYPTSIPGYMSDLYGALVDQFDINGSIIGSGVKSTVVVETDEDGEISERDRHLYIGAAIYIDETAYVDTINVMSGADIQGNILSFHKGNAYYDESLRLILDVEGRLYDAHGYLTEEGNAAFYPNDLIRSPLITTMTFGKKAGLDGEATDEVDKNFSFVYKDNINYFKYELNPGAITLDDVEINEAELVIDNLPDDVSGSIFATTFSDYWRTVAMADGLTDYLFDGDLSVRISTENDRVYAEVVTPGLIDLEFKAGITEFQGNKAYVNALRIERGATLTLTADESDPSILPEIHVYADFIPIFEVDFNMYGKASTPDNPNSTIVKNNGRISGDGSFYLGQRRILDGDFLGEHGIIREALDWEGTFESHGTLAPGANDGEGVGTLKFFSDLVMGENHVYEATISRIRQKDQYDRDIDLDGNVIDENGNLLDSQGRVIGQNKSPVYVETNDLIEVTGNTTLNGTLSIQIAPGSVFSDETTTYSFVKSGSITAGSMFTNYDYNVSFLNIAPGYTRKRDGYEEMVLTIVRDMTFFQKKAKTFNETSTARAIDNSLFDSPMVSYSMADKSNTDTDIRSMLNQIGGSIRANSAMMNLWNPSEMVFNRVGWGNGQMQTGDRGRLNWDRMCGRTARMLGQSPYSTRSGSFWADSIHTSFDAEADGNADKYRYSRTGFMVGAEWNLTPYSAVGAIAAYTDTKLKQTGDKVDSDDYMLGAYFVFAPMNEFEIKTYIGLGFQEYDMNRYIRNGNIVYDHITGDKGINDRYRSDTKGNSFNFSLELSRPLMLHPTFILRPTLGVDAQHIWQNGFSENDFEMWNDSYGTGYYGLKFKRMHFDRILCRAGFSSETTGPRGGIRMRAFYVTDVGGNDYPESKQVFKTGGEQFLIRGTKLSRNYLNLGVGANLWLDGERTCSLFFDYDSNIYNCSRKIYAHSISAGFVQNF